MLQIQLKLDRAKLWFFSGSASCDNFKQNILGLGMQVIVWRWLFFFTLCAVMTLALLPTSGASGFPGQDKLIHLMVFAGLFFIGAKACRRKSYRSQPLSQVPSNQVHSSQTPRKWLYLYIGLFAYGVLMEFLQGQTTYRSMEALDLLADSLGLVVGHCSLVLFSRLGFQD